MGPSARAFPYGLTNSAGDAAYLNLSGDEIVAVELEDGGITWKRAGAGRPLLVTEAGLVAVRRRDRKLELVVLDPVTGKDRRVVGPLPVPDWVAQEWDRPDGFVASAELHEGQPRVMWRATKQYHGGAAPSPEVLGDVGVMSTGVVQVDDDAGQLRTLTGVDTHELDAVDRAPSTGTPVTSADCTYRVSTRPSSDGTTAVSLTASRVSDGELLWETVLDRSAARRPPPLRP